MTFDQFCEKVGKIYDELPGEIKDRFSISVEECPSLAMIEKMKTDSYSRIYGYWNPMTPSNITLCYWAFREVSDFTEERINAVIKHEFEHLLMNPLGLNHSEHR